MREFAIESEEKKQELICEMEFRPMKVLTRSMMRISIKCYNSEIRATITGEEIMGTGAEQRKSFTLIELLIVVAIIGVLAAIAIPNFIQAQVRAKLARVAADYQALNVALDSYNIDNNHYPLFGEYKFPSPKRNLISYRLIPLTTCQYVRWH